MIQISSDHFHCKNNPLRGFNKRNDHNGENAKSSEGLRILLVNLFNLLHMDKMLDIRKQKKVLCTFPVPSPY